MRIHSLAGGTTRKCANGGAVACCSASAFAALRIPAPPKRNPGPPPASMLQARWTPRLFAETRLPIMQCAQVPGNAVHHGQFEGRAARTPRPRAAFAEIHPGRESAACICWARSCKQFCVPNPTECSAAIFVSSRIVPR